MYQRVIRLTFCALAGGLLVGCASNSDLMEVRQIAEQAQADATMAKDTANEAKSTAQQAMQMSQATDERINRMFRRSMQK